MVDFKKPLHAATYICESLTVKGVDARRFNRLSKVRQSVIVYKLKGVLQYLNTSLGTQLESFRFILSSVENMTDEEVQVWCRRCESTTEQLNKNIQIREKEDQAQVFKSIKITEPDRQRFDKLSPTKQSIVKSELKGRFVEQMLSKDQQLTTFRSILTTVENMPPDYVQEWLEQLSEDEKETEQSVDTKLSTINLAISTNTQLTVDVLNNTGEVVQTVKLNFNPILGNAHKGESHIAEQFENIFKEDK